MKADTFDKIKDWLDFALSDYGYADLDITKEDENDFKIKAEIWNTENVEFTTRVAEKPDTFGDPEIEICMCQDSADWQPISCEIIWTLIASQFYDNLASRRFEVERLKKEISELRSEKDEK